RDTDRDQKVAQIDGPIRKGLIQRFEAEAKEILSRGDPVHQLGTLGLLGEMGKAAAGGEWRLAFVRGLARDVADLVKGKNPEVREAAVRALGRTNPDPDAALPPIKDLLDKGRELSLRRAAAESLASLAEGTRNRPGRPEQDPM